MTFHFKTGSLARSGGPLCYRALAVRFDFSTKHCCRRRSVSSGLADQLAGADEAYEHGDERRELSLFRAAHEVRRHNVNEDAGEPEDGIPDDQFLK